MKRLNRGFTLLELLIVVAIIAILSLVVIVVINPGEMLKKTRDSQRISDLDALKKGINIYIAGNSASDLSSLETSPNFCLETGNQNAQISYGYERSTKAQDVCKSTIDLGQDVTTGAGFDSGNTCFSSSSPANIDGSGWIPFAFNAASAGGFPLDRLPIDPSRGCARGIGTTDCSSSPYRLDQDQTNSSVTGYRFVCQGRTTDTKPANVFELDAVLESDYYAQNQQKMARDGGDNDAYYEVGTSLRLLGNGANF